jgi:putative transposase
MRSWLGDHSSWLASATNPMELGCCRSPGTFSTVDGFLMRKRFLLLDRDPLYTSQFRALLASAGVTPIRLPPSSPNLNAYAERFVRSTKSECLNKLVLLGEGHLRAVVREYVAHYHEERNHQGLAGQLILPPANLNQPGPIVCRERLGGLLRFYHRKAA